MSMMKEINEFVLELADKNQEFESMSIKERGDVLIKNERFYKLIEKKYGNRGIKHLMNKINKIK